MEWVKLHLSWADGLQALTDDDDNIDEAACGRFFLGLLQYIKTGEKPKMSGPEKVLFAMAVADLKKDYVFKEQTKNAEEAKRQAISDARRDAANARWSRAAEQPQNASSVQTDANACTSMQKNAADSNNEQSVQIAPIKNKDIRDKNKDTDKEIEKEKNKKKKDADANGLPAGENKTPRPGRQKPVTEARYDQRPNEEPDGSSVPQWLLDREAEITGYSDPAGNQDAPDRPDIHKDG